MLKRNFKIVLDTVQSLKITLLSTVALNAPPHLFNSVNIRQFDCSLFLVKSMMNSVNSRWVTDLSLLLRVVITVVNFAQFFSQKVNIEPYQNSKRQVRESHCLRSKEMKDNGDLKIHQDQMRNEYRGSIFPV